MLDERRHVRPTGASRWKITVQGFPDPIDASTVLVENVLRHTSYRYRMNVFSPTREPNRKVRACVNESVRSTNAVKLVPRFFNCCLNICVFECARVIFFTHLYS